MFPIHESVGAVTLSSRMCTGFWRAFHLHDHVTCVQSIPLASFRRLFTITSLSEPSQSWQTRGRLTLKYRTIRNPEKLRPPSIPVVAFMRWVILVIKPDHQLNILPRWWSPTYQPVNYSWGERMSRGHLAFPSVGASDEVARLIEALFWCVTRLWIWWWWCSCHLVIKKIK